ncbi:MAG: uroporphyrinogen-III synthase [Candidatus Dormibacteria bacterium]
MTPERPLHGRRVLVTRAPDQAQPVITALHEAGADVVHVALIEHVVLVDDAAVRGACERLAAHHGRRWLVLTSATTVAVIAPGVTAAGGLPEHTRVLAVGPATAAALAAAGLPVDVVPARADAAAAAQALVEDGVSGARVWFPRAAAGRDVLPERLRAAGALVELQAVYRTALPAQAAAQLAQCLEVAEPAAIVLYSGSALAHLLEALGRRPYPAAAVPVCVGPVTADAARRAHLPRPVMARATDPAAVVRAVVAGLTREPLP